MNSYSRLFRRFSPDNNQLESDLQSYRHAFETTSVDRDRLRAELNAAKERVEVERLAWAAYVWMNEANYTSQEIGVRLMALEKGTLRSQSASVEDALSRASDGLILLADDILRDYWSSDLGLELVKTALALDDRFRGVRHCLNVYFARSNKDREYANYLSKGVEENRWPEVGARSAQKAAQERNLPPVLLATLPKSGSVFLWTTLQKSLGMPHFGIALSSGKGPMQEMVVPKLAEVFSEGGFVTIGHIEPTEENVNILKENGLNKLIVHFRDPRQAAVSWWYYNTKIGMRHDTSHNQSDVEAWLWEYFVEPAAEWIKGWLNLADNDPDLEIFVSTQESMAGHETEHVEKIAKFLNIPTDELDMEIAEKSEEMHFRKGDKNEWLTFFSEDFKRRSLAAIPNELAARFGWHQI